MIWVLPGRDCVVNRKYGYKLIQRKLDNIITALCDL